MADWISFYDLRHSLIYVNARHRDVHYRKIADDIRALVQKPSAAVLDYGCGSGILAIAAAKLGAATVTGTDVDPQAIEASRANAARNGAAVAFALPDALAPGKVDIVVANILANPLRLLAAVLAARVRDGGAIVLCGILEAQVAAVARAYRRWFKLGAWGSDDGRVALAGRRT